MREREPHVACQSALFVAETGIVDYTHVRTVVSAGAGNDTIDSTGDNYGTNPYEPDGVRGDEGTDSATVNRIDKVTAADIRRVASKTFTVNNRTIAYIDNTPTQPTAAAKGGTQ